MERRDLRLLTLSACAAEVRQLREQGYHRTGQWDLAMICDHLDKTCRMTVDGSPFHLPFFLRPVLRFFFLGKVMRGEPLGMKGKAPKELCPGPNLEENEVVDRFLATLAELENPATEFQELHPVFGRVTREQWLKIQAWHNSHHLSFLVPRDPIASSSV